MEQNKKRKFLPIVSIVVGVMYAFSIFSKYHTGESGINSIGTIIVGILFSIIFILWGVLSLSRKSDENKSLNRLTKTLKSTIIIVFIIITIPLILLLLSGGDR